MKKIRFFAVIFTVMMALQVCPAAAEDQSQEEYLEVHIEQKLSGTFDVEKKDEEGFLQLSGSSYKGCYGDQLTGLSREFYDVLVARYARNRTAGSYQYTLKNAVTFRAQVEEGDIIENHEYTEAKNKIRAAMQMAMDAFSYDHPEVFWMRAGRHAYDVGAKLENGIWTGKITAVTVMPEEIYPGASGKIKEYNAAVERAADEVKARLENNADRYDVLKHIHNYICEQAYYPSGGGLKVHSTEPFFLGDKGVVCEGYAKTLKVLCDQFQIPCACVSGGAVNQKGKSEDHMWNYVQMEDGSWYLVDATWDDQKDKVYDTYFLAGWDSLGFNGIKISDERQENRDFSSTEIMLFSYPELSQNSYKGHPWGKWNVLKEPTVFQAGMRERVCPTCGKSESEAIKKLPATVKLSMTKIPLKEKQSTTAFKVSGLAKGDRVEGYQSSDKKVAVVNSKGKITAKKKGTAKITVTLASGKKASATVKVQSGTVKTTKVAVNSQKVSLKRGKSFSIKATVSPLTSGQKVSYASSDKKIAVVDRKGIITAKKKGKTTITVRSGNKSARIKVTVK